MNYGIFDQRLKHHCWKKHCVTSTVESTSIIKSIPFSKRMFCNSTNEFRYPSSSSNEITSLFVISIVNQSSLEKIPEYLFAICSPWSIITLWIPFSALKIKWWFIWALREWASSFVICCWNAISCYERSFVKKNISKIVMKLMTINGIAHS